MIKIDRIPEISNRKLLKRLQKLTPLICTLKENHIGSMKINVPTYFKLEYDKNNINYIRNTSFIWDPKLGKKIDPIAASRHTIITYHKYGAPAFFKPSLAEIVAQLPKNFNGIFCIDPKDIDAYNIIDNCHFVKTFLWEDWMKL